MKKVPIRDRFWTKVSRPSPDACWEWLASKRNGYGVIGSGQAQRVVYANRYSWEFWIGPIPSGGPGHHGWCIIHTCDNRACVNPAHMRLGSQGENVRDMIDKGRRGLSSKPWGRLLPDQVREIRNLVASGVAMSPVGERFGITRQSVSMIVNRHIWKDIE